MEGYKIGQKPPGLAEDGSFEIGLDVRGFSVVGEEGAILVVDKTTGLLVEEPEEE